MFVAYTFENLNCIPYDATFKMLEAIDDSEAMQKFYREKSSALNSDNKRIHATTIDDAVKALEDIIDDSIDEMKLPKEETLRLKIGSRGCCGQVKSAFCDWIQRQGVMIVLD